MNPVSSEKDSVKEIELERPKWDEMQKAIAPEPKGK